MVHLPRLYDSLDSLYIAIFELITYYHTLRGGTGNPPSPRGITEREQDTAKDKNMSNWPMIYQATIVYSTRNSLLRRCGQPMGT